MSGPPAWLWWALAVSLAAVPVCLIVAITSALLDRRKATEATQPERTRP